MNEDLRVIALLSDDLEKASEHFKREIWFSSFSHSQRCLTYICVLSTHEQRS